MTLVSRVDELATFDAVFAFAVRGIWRAEPDGANRPPLLIAGPRITGGRRRAPRQAAILCRPSPESALGYCSLDERPRRQGRPSRTPPDVVLPSRIVARPTVFARPVRIPTICVCSAPGSRWRVGRGGAACDSSPARVGKRIDLRATMNAPRSTGWESVPAGIDPADAPGGVLLLCDVSRSMHSTPPSICVRCGRRCCAGRGPPGGFRVFDVAD